jgi:hypothetical protein
MPHALPLVAFGFTNLPMLGWLAAAAVPILIHLWRRKMYRETSWAAMEYLLAAVQRQSRRLRFEQWFLLAIRILIVVLIVLAVAEPYTGPTGVEPPAGDSSKSDNQKLPTLTKRQAMRVLCIDGRPAGRSFQGAADLLALALDPQGKKSPIEVETAPETALVDRKLDPYDCVFLCNVAQFTTAEANVLDAYLQSGGALVFFLGDQVMAERYNRMLGQGRAGGAQILPAQFGPLDEAPHYRLDPLGYRHPVLQPFRGRGQASLVTTPVLKHFKLSIPENSKSQTVLALPNGDPLVVEGPVHRGRVIVVATSADASWSAMPLWPSFVPLVQEMAHWSSRKPMQQRGPSPDAAQSNSAPIAAETPANRLPIIILYTVLLLLFIETFIGWIRQSDRNLTQRREGAKV